MEVCIDRNSTLKVYLGVPNKEIDMRLLGLILGMVMVTGTAHAESHLINCNEIKKTIDEYLMLYSVESKFLGKQVTTMSEGVAKDVIIDIHTKSSEKALTAASQFATIYIAKCK